MISAWASSNQVVPGQLKTDEKSNEITAIPYLLKLLDLSGCIITIDAMGTQKKIAETMIQLNSDYILALKENHKTLYDNTVLFFDNMESMKKEGYVFDEKTTVDGGHGRIETRRTVTTSDIDWLDDKESWPGLKSLGMVGSSREINGETSFEKRYYISSLDDCAGLFGNSVRKHWGIENCVHWVLDTAFREDESRIRKGFGPENFAAIRHIALNLLKENKSFKGSMKSKRLNAAMNKKYLEDVVFGQEMITVITRPHSECLHAVALDPGFHPVDIFFLYCYPLLNKRCGKIFYRLLRQNRFSVHPRLI